MAKIQDLSILDKPREKAERFGIEKLSDEELLAIIINVGTVGHSSLDIARDLLNEARSLNGLLNKPYQYFQTFKGLKKAKAIKLGATLEIARRINEKQRLIHEEMMEATSDNLYKRYAISLAGELQENFIIVILNKNKQIVYEKTLYKGNDSYLTISLRDILRLLMLNNAYYFYLIHNHPNCDPFPSESDVSFTKKIQQKTEKLGVKLLDHLIISRDGYYSFLHERLFGEGIQSVVCPEVNLDIIEKENKGVYLVPKVYLDEFDSFDKKREVWKFHPNDKRIVKRLKRK